MGSNYCQQRLKRLRRPYAAKSFRDAMDGLVLKINELRFWQTSEMRVCRGK